MMLLKFVTVPRHFLKYADRFCRHLYFTLMQRYFDQVLLLYSLSFVIVFFFSVIFVLTSMNIIKEHVYC